MKNFLILFWLFVTLGIFAQDREIFLSEIPFEPNFSDTSLAGRQTLFVLNSEGDTVKSEILTAENKSITINNSGDYDLHFGNQNKQVKIIPGWFSVLPPLVAILLALVFRQVLLALFAGIYLGAFFIYDYHFIEAFYRIADTLLVNIIADTDHVLIILFTLIIGGIVGIISANGGTKGLAQIIVKKARDARSGMLASWFLGIAIFFDDYSNSLLVGNLMRPITDKLKISREKLAYIVDSTAAPVTSLVVISTWIGYELGLISDGLNSIGSNLGAYDVFVQSIIYRFYPVSALVFVFMVAYFKRDFGQMYKAEIKARKFGVITEKDFSEPVPEKEEKKSHWLNAVIPIAVLLIGTMAGLVVTGTNELALAGVKDYGLREIISASNSYYALLWGSFTASVVAVIVTLASKSASLEKTLNAFMKGLQSLLPAVVILILAWGISKITAELHTADYLISLLIDVVDIKLLATLVFVVCAVTSFATGTSWGTMAIVTPIVIPLSWKLGLAAGLPVQEINGYLISVVAAVLAGSVFGDHCSPIADTTILSSLASGCNHISHVNTQLPYALVVGFASLVFGSLLTAFGLPVWLAYIFIFAFLSFVLFYFGKKTE